MAIQGYWLVKGEEEEIDNGQVQFFSHLHTYILHNKSATLSADNSDLALLPVMKHLKRSSRRIGTYSNISTCYYMLLHVGNVFYDDLTIYSSYVLLVALGCVLLGSGSC